MSNATSPTRPNVARVRVMAAIAAARSCAAPVMEPCATVLEIMAVRSSSCRVSAALVNVLEIPSTEEKPRYTPTGAEVRVMEAIADAMSTYTTPASSKIGTTCVLPMAVALSAAYFIKTETVEVLEATAPMTKKPAWRVPLTFVFDEMEDAKLKKRDATAELTVLDIAAEAIIPLMHVRVDEVAVLDVASAARGVYLARLEAACVLLMLAHAKPDTLIGAAAVCVLEEADDVRACALPTWAAVRLFDIAAEDALWRPVGLADVPVLEEFAAARLSVRVRVDVPQVAEMPTP
jgi:hypothetical protein